MSTVAIFGAAALGQATQAQADRALELALAAGVNHIDVAPSYGKAEELIGPWMPRIRKQVFLGCKTTERTQEGAAAELRRSLERLRVDSFDLFQLHSVTNMEVLDQVLRPGGALDAVLDARREGLTKYIGITGHGHAAPRVFGEALRRFDFDTVLFPINFVLYAIPEYRRDAKELLRECRRRDVGTMIIKAAAKRLWHDRPHRYTTWYEPFDDPAQIQAGVNFALSQDVTGLCTAGDLEILPHFIHACENFTPLDAAAQAELIATAPQYESVFAPGGPLS